MFDQLQTEKREARRSAVFAVSGAVAAVAAVWVAAGGAASLAVALLAAVVIGVQAEAGRDWTPARQGVRAGRVRA